MKESEFISDELHTTLTQESSEEDSGQDEDDGF